MMRKFLTHALPLLATLAFLLPTKSVATHVIGGEMYYDCIGDNEYIITLIIYRDCFGGLAPFDLPAFVTIFNGDGEHILADTSELEENPIIFGEFSFEVTPNLSPNAGGLCLLPIPENACVDMGVYSDTIFLPPNDIGYLLVYQRCCRNGAAININDPGDLGISVYTIIPSVDSETDDCWNSAPRFNTYPPIAICVDTPLEFDHSATDPDGDSLVYNMCVPITGGQPNNPVPVLASFPLPAEDWPPVYPSVEWAPSYSTEDQMGGLEPLAIDPETGLLTAHPNEIGQYVIGVCVSEYRDGVLIGTEMRDFQYNVSDCESTVMNVGAGNDVYLCLAESITLDGSAQNEDTLFWDNEDLLDDPTILNPTANITETTTFCLTVLNLEFECEHTDCITIYVFEPFEVEAGDDQTITLGESTQLQAVGGFTFLWEPSETLSDDNIYNPIATPIETTTYFVTAVDELGCYNATDSVTITVEEELAVEREEHFTPLKLYPNPSSESIYLEFKSENIKQITCFNSNGQIIWEWNLDQSQIHSIDISNWLNGFYLFQIEGMEGEKSTFNFVKN